MKGIIAYEMICNQIPDFQISVECARFEKRYWDEYMQIYNECFFEMRKELEIEPLDFYSDFSQMKDKAENTFLYVKNGEIMGAVSCYGNEIDDLIVKKSLQGKGIGKELLIWGMRYIRQQGHENIVLHVAEWNQKAVSLYKGTGFVIQKMEKVR